MTDLNISILCVAKDSNYHSIPGLDLWTASRNAYNFDSLNPIICHPPCQQWSRLHKFARENHEEKQLAFFCWEKVNTNGGIFEHPAGSHFFKTVKADRSKIFSINQHWFGFPTRKRTYLYFHNCKPLSFPLSFDHPVTTLEKVNPRLRSIMPLSFCEWLVMCILESTGKGHLMHEISPSAY